MKLPEKIHLIFGDTPAHSSTSLRPPISSRSAESIAKPKIPTNPAAIAIVVIIQSVFVMIMVLITLAIALAAKPGSG